MKTKQEIKKIMKGVIRKGERVLDIEITDNVIWVLTKNGTGIYWNYSIMKDTGNVYKNLVDNLGTESYHWGNIEI